MSKLNPTIKRCSVFDTTERLAGGYGAYATRQDAVSLRAWSGVIEKNNYEINDFFEVGQYVSHWGRNFASSNRKNDIRTLKWWKKAGAEERKFFAIQRWEVGSTPTSGAISRGSLRVKTQKESFRLLPCFLSFIWCISSVDRTSDCLSEGHGFEPRMHRKFTIKLFIHNEQIKSHHQKILGFWYDWATCRR